MSQKNTPKKQEVETTGHSWDGIEEFNNPLPKWWLYLFYGTIIWGIIYVILFPAWPMVTKATPGLLGFSTRQELAKDIASVDARNEARNAVLAEADLNTLQESDPELYSYAVNAGKSIYAVNCSQCHGAGAAGVQNLGYPNLQDDEWLWGGAIDDEAGTLDEIAYTVRHGVRAEEDVDTRWSQMPAYGEILEKDEITSVVHFVRQISGQEHDADLALAGSDVFLDNCAACHGDEGKGDIYQGAPNLTDAIWLYGGSVEKITETVAESRFGVMPAWGMRLSPAEVNAVALYVHQLGGGR